jgi:hypothetical protein
MRELGETYQLGVFRHVFHALWHALDAIEIGSDADAVFSRTRQSCSDFFLTVHYYLLRLPDQFGNILDLVSNRGDVRSLRSWGHERRVDIDHDNPIDLASTLAYPL